MVNFFPVDVADYFKKKLSTMATPPATFLRTPRHVVVPPPVTPAPNNTVSPAPFANPRQDTLGASMEQLTMKIREDDRPANTRSAYDNKTTEFYQFCDFYAPDDPFRRHLTYDKAHQFMWYTTFREQKKQGGRKKGPNQRFFDVEEYQELIKNHFDDNLRAKGTHPVPKRPISKSLFDQYKACLKNIWLEEVAHKRTSVAWEQIWCEPLRQLRDHVINRLPKIKKQNFEEKLASEFAPYMLVQEYSAIEQELWNDSHNAVTFRSIVSHMRHRYCLLHLTSGLLRCESLHRAELSDFCGLRGEMDKDVHKMYLMINQIAQGKTNKGQKIYGRATRHRDVRRCCVGALAFYLMMRFHYTREFIDFTLEDWKNNEKWFDIKLLVDIANGTDFSAEMKHDSYATHIKKTLQKLGFPANKLLHLGRGLGTKMLEFLDEVGEEIRKMGWWNPGVMDNSYSAKIPISPIRKLAGYGERHTIYFNTRTAVIPPQELLDMTPIGKWCYKARDELSTIRDGGKQTAIQFVSFMCKLNEIFLQDCAAMQVLHPERSTHPMFNRIEAFSSPLYEQFKSQMQAALDTAEDPQDACLESVLPGVHEWHNLTNKSLNVLSTDVQNTQEALLDLRDKMTAIDNKMDGLDECVAKRMAVLFKSFADHVVAHTGAESPPSPTVLFPQHASPPGSPGGGSPIGSHPQPG